MKILIDILTPKQCMLFSKLSEHLEKRGHQVYRTTRRYREVNELLELNGVSARIIGEHGGKELEDKLRSSAERILGMIPVFREINADLSVSFSSPEMARVSYGLGIPHICVNDSPHAEAVARLTVPLSARLLSPSLIPRRAWTRYGISSEDIIQYKALDPWVWLKDFEPNKGVLGQLGLEESRPIVTFRPEETFASYLLGKNLKATSVIPVIEKLLEDREGVQIVAVPRYQDQIDLLRTAFGERIIISGSIIDGPSLLYYTSAFIGAGGTMSAEAALLGVPTFSCYPGESFYIEKYLMRKGLIERETDPERLAMRISETIDDLSHVKMILSERARNLVKNFDDPIRIMSDEIENFSRE